MRFTVIIQFDRYEIPKDRSRMFLSLIKFWLKKENVVYQDNWHLEGVEKRGRETAGYVGIGRERAVFEVKKYAK